MLNQNIKDDHFYAQPINLFAVANDPFFIQEIKLIDLDRLNRDTKNTTNNSTKRGRTYTRNSSTRYEGVKLNARGNMLVQADNDLITQGAQIIAGNNANNVLVLNAGGDMRLDSVNNETYSYYHTSSSGWFSSSSTTRERQRVRSQGTNIVASNLLINSNNDTLINDKTNNVNLIGSQINVENETLIKAKGDVNIYAGLDFNYDLNQSSKSSWFGLSSRSSGSRRSQQLLNASNLDTRKGDLSLLAGNNITVVASNLTSGKNLNLQADNNVLIAAAEQLGNDEDWSKKSGVFRGGDLYNTTEARRGNTLREYISSKLRAANDININAGRVNIVGSTLLAGNNIKAQTDVGDIDISTATNNQNGYRYTKEVRVGLGDFAKSLTRPDEMIKTDNGRLRFKIADATYDEVGSKESNTQNKSSVLQAGNNLILDAAGDINITGSQLLANTSKTEQGELALLANGDISIKEATDSVARTRKETRGKAELSIVVQHQAVEVVNAVKALEKAKKQLKQANEDYRQYQKDLVKQKAALAQLEQGYKNKDVGINYDDIRELREFIQSSEGDKDWYKVGIAAATLNLTSKGTLLIQQTAAAAQSAATYGFNAGVQLDIEASKTNAEQNQRRTKPNHRGGQYLTRQKYQPHKQR